MSAILVAIALSNKLQACDDDCVRPTVQEVLPGKGHDDIRSVVAPSMYDCAAECKLSPKCLFFTFDPEKRACQLLKKTNSSFHVGSGVFFSSIQEWKMPLTGACDKASCGPNSRCTVGRNGQPLCLDDVLIGAGCTGDNDCHISMTLCFLGRCLCHPGYSHNIRRNSCDRVCRRFGDTMTPYIGLGIKGHNKMIIKLAEEEGEKALDKCMSACVQEASFLCKTVDFRRLPLNCHLSSEGYLDVTYEEREQAVSGWSLAVRNCHVDAYMETDNARHALRNTHHVKRIAREYVHMESQLKRKMDDANWKYPILYPCSGTNF